MCDACLCTCSKAPEVRGAHDNSDFARRAQLMLFSGLASMDGWNTGFEPWQPDISAANAKMFAALARERSKLATFLFTAYNRQSTTGVPVVRSLVVDYDVDTAAFAMVDQFLLGDGLMVAPTPVNATSRNVTFPLGSGSWADYWGKSPVSYAGGKTYTLAAADTDVLVFQQKGKAVPLVAPAAYFSNGKTSSNYNDNGDGDGNIGGDADTGGGDSTVLVLRVHADGQAAEACVYDDDGITTKESTLGESFRMNVTTTYPQQQHHTAHNQAVRSPSAASSRVMLHAVVDRATWIPPWKKLQWEVVSSGWAANDGAAGLSGSAVVVECGGVSVPETTETTTNDEHVSDGILSVKKASVTGWYVRPRSNTVVVYAPFNAGVGFMVNCSVSVH